MTGGGRAEAPDLFDQETAAQGDGDCNDPSEPVGEAKPGDAPKIGESKGHRKKNEDGHQDI